jgi:hypothetical protein
MNRGKNADYQVPDIVLMLMMSVLAGAKHLSHTVFIKSDMVIRQLFNWKQFPDDTTFGRIFKLFSHKHCKELSDVESMARTKVWKKNGSAKSTLIWIQQ